MLKERQLCILSDLENTKVFISAKALAEKYDVSLRTVRNDIDEIAYEVAAKEWDMAPKTPPGFIWPASTPLRSTAPTPLFSLLFRDCFKNFAIFADRKRLCPFFNLKNSEL